MWNTKNKIIVASLIVLATIASAVILGKGTSHPPAQLEELSDIQQRKKDFDEKFESLATTSGQSPIDDIKLAPLPYKVGDKLGNFTISKIEPHRKTAPILLDNAQISLVGEAKITGRFYVVRYCTTPDGATDVCKNQADKNASSSEFNLMPDEVSSALLPFPLAERVGFFLDANDVLLAQFGDKLEGTTTISIKDYYVTNCDCHSGGSGTTLTKIYNVQ